MPWIVGIDEAGYGPNLGPFVMSAAVLQVPPDESDSNLWRLLKRAVRKHSGKDDARLVIDDSKLVYSPAQTIKALERGVLAVLHAWQPCLDFRLCELLDLLASPSLDELSEEHWYTGTEPVPSVADDFDLATASDRLAGVLKDKGLGTFFLQSTVVCTPRFNSLVDRWGSKGAVLGDGLGKLLGWCLQTAQGTDSVHITVDKHGGRNNYAAMLQEVFPGAFVAVHEEGMNRSSYSLLGLEREVRLTFQPRADSGHLNVALASMTSKYLREMLMVEFNRFWQTRIDGLKPTAGYPGDASRFWDEIRPTVRSMGIAENALWRCR
jgi:ribonuclease HII